MASPPTKRSTPPLPPSPPGYRIGLNLGSGGYASVWLAWRQGPLGFQLPVAIKVLNPDHAENEAARRRFFAEARMLSALDHPNIVKILDAGECDARPYYVMEYVRGTSLARLLAEHQRMLPLDASLLIGIGIGSAVHSAHIAVDLRGEPMEVVHRDVNPANILVGTHGQIKLIDFGIAISTITSRDTRINVVKGNPRYLSPEQAFGMEADRRTDIYALGLTIYEAITGVAPLTAESKAEGLALARQADFPPPSKHRPATPEMVDRTLMKALERDPKARYDTMEGFVRRLHACLMRVNPTLLPISLNLLLSKVNLPPLAPPEEGTVRIADPAIALGRKPADDDATRIFRRSDVAGPKPKDDKTEPLTLDFVFGDEPVRSDDEPTRVEESQPTVIVGDVE